MSKEQKIHRISDLPYYKEEHGEILSDMDIRDLDDLLEALYDDERSNELVERLKGIGPRIKDQWVELLENRGELDEEEETVVEEVEEPEVVEEEPVVEEAEIVEEVEEPEVVEEGGYFAAPKPELDDETRRLFEQRKLKTSKKPDFKRQEWFRYKKLGEKWRRPKGMHSKLRRRIKYRPPMVSVGYRAPKKVRGLHSSGFEEIMIHNPSQLEGMDPKRQAARVAATVGYKKRLEIEKKASEMGIHILNRTR